MSFYAGYKFTNFSNINAKDGIFRFGAALSAALTDTATMAVYTRGTSLYFWNGTSETQIGAAGTGSTSTWDELYDSDKTLTIDGTTLTFSLTHATNDGLTITGSAGSAGACIQVTNSGSGPDIQGTSDTWLISKAGLITCVGVTTTSDVTSTGAAIDWDLIDDNASALSFDAGGKAGIIAIVTTNDAEGVTMSGTLTVSGVLTASVGVSSSDGTCTFTDNSNAANGLVFVNDTVTTYGNASDAGPVHFNSSSLTTGHLLTLSLDASELAGGSYIRCWEQDAGAAVFTIGEDGLTTIAGNAAGTDALVLTAGDITVTSGDIVVTAGSIDITEDATDNVALPIISAATSVDVVTITADSLTGTESALSISVDALVDGVGIKVENVGEAITSGELLQILNTESGNLAAKTGNVISVTSSLEETAGTVTSNYDVALFSRTDKQNFAAQGDAQGSIVKISKNLDKTLGTLVDAVIGLEIESAVANSALPLGDTVKITEVGVGATALNIVAAGVGADDVHIAGSGAHTSDKAVLNVTASGNIAAGGNIVRVDAGAIDADVAAVFVEFDFANLADTNEPIGVLIDGGGKKLQALKVDADPIAGDVALFHSDAVIADNKGVVHITAAGAIANGSAALRIALSGTPAATAYAQEIDLTGVTATNNPGALFVNGVGKDVVGILVDVDNTDIHAVSIDGSGAITSAGNMLKVDNDSTPAANANVVQFTFSGTDTNNPTILDLLGTGKDVQAISADTDNTATNAVEISGSGALSGGVMLSVANDGTPAANTDAIVKFAFTGTATNDPINLQIDHNSIGPAIDIDQDGNDGTDPSVGIRINTDNAGAGNQIALDVDQVDESKSYFARFDATTAWTSTKSPETDAEAGWVKIMVGSTAYAIPYYALS